MTVLKEIVKLTTKDRWEEEVVKTMIMMMEIRERTVKIEEQTEHSLSLFQAHLLVTRLHPIVVASLFLLFLIQHAPKRGIGSLTGALSSDQ